MFFQLCVILLVSFVGEILRQLLPLPIPASIYGLLIMLFLLITKLLKVENVKKAGHFLIDVMPLMFIPPAVGLIDVWGTDIRHTGPPDCDYPCDHGGCDGGCRQGGAGGPEKGSEPKT